MKAVKLSEIVNNKIDEIFNYQKKLEIEINRIKHEQINSLEKVESLSESIYEKIAFEEVVIDKPEIDPTKFKKVIEKYHGFDKHTYQFEVTYKFIGNRELFKYYPKDERGLDSRLFHKNAYIYFPDDENNELKVLVNYSNLDSLKPKIIDLAETQMETTKKIIELNNKFVKKENEILKNNLKNKIQNKFLIFEQLK